MDLLTSRQTTYTDKKIKNLHYSRNTFTELEFESCIFEECIFIESVFSNCKFIDCTFMKSSISALKPFNSRFNTVSFLDSKVMGCDWTKAAKIQDLSFERCNISYSNFSFLKIHKLKLIECISEEVSFNESDLTDAIFTKTDFTKAVFSNTNLTNADFRKAINYGIDFHFNVLKHAKFSLPEAASLLKSLDITVDM